jgi:hypothetical protein
MSMGFVFIEIEFRLGFVWKEDDEGPTCAHDQGFPSLQIVGDNAANHRSVKKEKKSGNVDLLLLHH